MALHAGPLAPDTRVDAEMLHTLALKDAVELRTRAMDDNGVKADPVEEAQAQGELVELVEHGAANLDHCELGRLRRVRRCAKDAQVPLDLALCTNRVQQPRDRVLSCALAFASAIAQASHKRGPDISPGDSKAPTCASTFKMDAR